MTTTDLYQGMDPNAKNSSRVLAPPGGASSFSIFGGGDEPITSPVVGPVSPPTPAAGTKTPNKPTEEGITETRDRLYGGGATTSVHMRQGGNPKNMGTFDPIACVELSAPKQEVSVLPPKEEKPVHTSTRVRQPPGGASSGLW